MCLQSDGCWTSIDNTEPPKATSRAYREENALMVDPIAELIENALMIDPSRAYRECPDD